MPLQSSARVLKKPPRLDDEVRFLRSWIEKPLHMGAVMPSGRVLARTMAQYVDVNSRGPVVELGPGTGAITNALIDHGIDQKRLVLVEYNPGFCALLRDRYPHAKVVQGDAYRLRDSLWDMLSVPASAVVSGLPLVTKPMLTRLKLIRDAFLALAPGAPFVQFTYSVAPPIPKSLPGVLDRSLRAHLDEPSAGTRLGVSQGLMPPGRRPRFALDGHEPMPALKILVIPGSLRTGSLNARLAATAAHELAQAGVDVTRISLGDFSLPIYDGDLQTKSGVPETCDQSQAHDRCPSWRAGRDAGIQFLGATIGQECDRLGDEGAGRP